MIDEKTEVRLVPDDRLRCGDRSRNPQNGRRIGVERKRADAPTITKSMHIALDNFKLDELIIVYPGEKRYKLAKGVEAVPLGEMVNAKLVSAGMSQLRGEGARLKSREYVIKIWRRSSRAEDAQNAWLLGRLVNLPVCGCILPLRRDLVRNATVRRPVSRLGMMRVLYRQS